MDKILLVICNGLSCFIICTILFQFMNERYKKSYSNRTLYIAAEIAMGITAFYINMLNFAILNLLIWFVGVGVTVYFLYYEDADRPIRRITESEVLVLCMSVCETLGVLLLHCFLQIGGILNIDVVMQYCLEVAFSKIVLIFLYYVLINRLIKRTEAACSREQYIIYGIMFFYSLVNMLVIVQNFRDGQKSYLSAVNMGCIVLADLYLLYYVKMADEKRYYENRVKALEQQAKMQYEYYLAQTEKYNQTIRILHDVDKHIRAIENLYGTEREHTAGEYAEAIRSTLAPLIPMSYTENPILNILLTDKNAVMQEKGIHSDIKIDNVDLSYIEPIDITTIFGNLLDNAIEAAANVDGEKYIFIKISAYHKMTVVHIENSCGNVKWKKRMPVSDKGKGRGIGLLNVKQSIDKNQAGRSSLAKESAIPPENFKMFFKEQVTSFTEDNKFSGNLKITIGENNYDLKVPFQTLRTGSEGEICNVWDLMEDYYPKSEDTSKVKNFLGNMSVFTRWYAYETRINDIFGDYEVSHKELS